MKEFLKKLLWGGDTRYAKLIIQSVLHSHSNYCHRLSSLYRSQYMNIRYIIEKVIDSLILQLEAKIMGASVLFLLENYILG